MPRNGRSCQQAVAGAGTASPYTAAMDRATWLRERRDAVRADYDHDAATYDDDPYSTAIHAAFVDRLVSTTPVGGVILDAPCGTGQYFARVTDAGRRVVGVDQSGGMLRQAEARRLADRVEQVGLQELTFDHEFDGAMTVDAMEHVPPEDWPSVLGNLVRAVHPGAHLYLTVEEVDDSRTDDGFAAARGLGLPVVPGEVIDGSTGGYHFYPGRDRVRGWLADEGLEIVAGADDPMDGWGYWHLIVRTPMPKRP
jgi:SAM-dependent methyltransferase